MQREQITDKEAICLVIFFVMGSTLIIGIAGDAKNDAWISGIVSVFMFLPMLLIYSRILSLFPGKDLFDILDLCFGKIPGKLIAVIYIWYAFHLGALVLRNYGEFINTVAMPETPILVSIVSLSAVCIIAVRMGVEVLARTTTFMIPLMYFIIAVVFVFVLPQLKLHFLKPVLGNGIMPVLKGAFSTFSFPFAETVLFIGVFSSLQTKKSPIKVYIWGTLFSAVTIIILTIRNIAVLGNMLGSFYFPSYEAVSMINLGDFIQRVEVSVSIIFIFCAFVKCSICLLVVCKGIGKMFNLKDYRSIVLQTGLLITYFSYTIYDNIMLMNYWAFKVYAYYAFPMEVIIPVILWVFAEIKAKRMPNKNVQS
jgi:spore germination protein (amino acid permease)